MALAIYLVRLSDKYFNLKYYSWSLKLFEKCFDFPSKVWTVSVETKIVVWLKKNNFFEMLILLSQVCWQPRAECGGAAAAMVSSISNIYIGIGNTQIQNIGIIQEI